MARIKYLEEEGATKEEFMKKMKTELETAKDLACIAEGQVASLEVEKEVLTNDVERYKRVLLNQRKDILKIRAGKIDLDSERKIKALQDELKAKTKMCEVMEKAKRELAKKVEEEVSSRAKAEADCAKFSKMVDILQDRTTTAEKTKAKSTVGCRDISKPGGWPRAGSCNFLHPTKAKEDKETDCHHWKKGSCKFSEKNCRFKHDPEKEAMNASKRKRSEEPEPRKEDREDFLIGLVKALAQGKAGEAQLGSGAGSSQRVEGQRNTRLRMGSPLGSSRGMENHERSRSYASMVGSDNSSYNQESREASSARGMEDQALIEQAVKIIQGLARPAQPASAMDKLQECIQLLTQQQAGRR